MADVKISQLPAATSIASTDAIPITQGGGTVTRKTTPALLVGNARAYFNKSEFVADSGIPANVTQVVVTCVVDDQPCLEPLVYKRAVADDGSYGSVNVAGAWWLPQYNVPVDLRQWGADCYGATDCITALNAACQFLYDWRGYERTTTIRMYGTFRLSSFTFPTPGNLAPITLEVNGLIRLTDGATITLNNSCSIVGVGGYGLSRTFGGPAAQVEHLGSTVAPSIRVPYTAMNTYPSSIQNVFVSGPPGTAFQIEAQCKLSNIGADLLGTADSRALVIDGAFWIEGNEIYAGGHRTGAVDPILITQNNVLRSGMYAGLIKLTAVKVLHHSIVIKPLVSAGGYCNDIWLERVSGELQLNGKSLIVLDGSSTHINNVRIEHPNLNDPDSGSGTAFFLKSIGDVRQVVLSRPSLNYFYYQGDFQYEVNAGNAFWLPVIDPASDPIQRFTHLPAYEGWAEPYLRSAWSRDYMTIGPTEIDAPNRCRPRQLSTILGVPYTQISQVHTDWTLTNATATAGQIDAYGGTSAVKFTTTGNSALVKFADFTDVAWSTGDWIILGIWIKDNGVQTIEYKPPYLHQWQADLNGYRPTSPPYQFYLGTYNDMMLDSEWKFIVFAGKKTGAGPYPDDYNFKFWFGLNAADGSRDQSGVCVSHPCAQRIPASYNIPDAVVRQYVRSLSAPWQVGSKRGDMILQKDQVLQIGGGVRLFSATAAPASGTWAVGDIVKNSNPSVGQPKGWVCTVAGTPGTWVSEGNL